MRLGGILGLEDLPTDRNFVPRWRFQLGQLWRPRFSAGLINPNDQVNSVHFGQTTVNLGHHVENITDDP
jgi:hypothetical protein